MRFNPAQDIIFKGNGVWIGSKYNSGQFSIFAVGILINSRKFND
jgi:hypothetical protein